MQGVLWNGSGVRQSMGYKDIDKIEFVIENIEKAINLVTEYRTRLISDGVTGKVDVQDIFIDEVLGEDVDPTEFEAEENVDVEEVMGVGEEE
jgi:type I restriction enzyme S subunit